MSVSICDMCNSYIDHDRTEGEWDVTDRNGDHYDFVCVDCFCGCDEFEEEIKDNKKTTEQIIQGMEKQVNSPEWKLLKEKNHGR